MHLAKLKDLYMTKNELLCQLWNLMTVYQYWIFNCNKPASPMQDVNNRGNSREWGEGCGNSLYLLLIFSVNLKLLYKIESINDF